MLAASAGVMPGAICAAGSLAPPWRTTTFRREPSGADGAGATCLWCFGGTVLAGGCAGGGFAPGGAGAWACPVEVAEAAGAWAPAAGKTRERTRASGQRARMVKLNSDPNNNDKKDCSAPWQRTQGVGRGAAPRLNIYWIRLAIRVVT